jgi:hypothetical protein
MIFPFIANIIATNPDVRFREVMRFGICFFMWNQQCEVSKIKINFINNPNLVKFGSPVQGMIDITNIKIAVDFDGTIVEHQYPAIGKEKLFAFRTLKELEKRGALLILWTFRTGVELDEAVEYCRKNGIEFYAINRNYPEEVPDDTVSRKIDADIYIDDKNLGGFNGWSDVWQTIFPFEMEQKEAEKRITSRKNIFKRLFSAKKRPDERQ